MAETRRLTTAEAAERLGVKAETLYAYASRGLVEPRRTPGGASTYDVRDVERLARAGRRSRRLPPLVFPSSLTLIGGGRVSYRGVDAVSATAEHGFEEVAEWLWTGAWPEHTRWPVDLEALDRVEAAQRSLADGVLPLDRLQVIAVVAGARDRRATAGVEPVPSAARRLIRLLVHGLPRADHRSARRVEPVRGVAEVLWTRLTRLPRTPERVAVLDVALGLLADHELASSTLAARLAAMVRADVADVVGAGLNVLGGSRHGGATLATESLLRDVARSGVGPAFDRHRSRGAAPGFGHALYPDGDPRAAALLERLAALDPPGDRLAVVTGALDAADRLDLPPPNVDLGLAGLAFCADMTPGAAEAIFAIARAAGWIAHAIEQYEQPTFMRARVDYVGPEPGS